jgi:hypothetical protein
LAILNVVGRVIENREVLGVAMRNIPSPGEFFRLYHDVANAYPTASFTLFRGPVVLKDLSVYSLEQELFEYFNGNALISR